jgi:hypothetical protein
LHSDVLLRCVIFGKTWHSALDGIPWKRFRDVALIISTTREDRRMPIVRPLPDVIRWRIAQVASELSDHAADHFLNLMGPVEPVSHGMAEDEGSWRLASYFGTRDDAMTIERAIAIVHREHPLMKTPPSGRTAA